MSRLNPIDWSEAGALFASFGAEAPTGPPSRIVAVPEPIERGWRVLAFRVLLEGGELLVVPCLARDLRERDPELAAERVRLKREHSALKVDAVT